MLVRTLHETQQRLQELTGGEVDAVLHSDGLSYLLHEAQEKLQRSEDLFSGAFEHAPIGMSLVSLKGQWLKVNRALCEVVGYSEAELLDRTFQDITHPGDLHGDLEHMRRLLAGEIRTYEMDKRYVHARGHLVSVLINVSLIRNGQGQPLYFIAQIQDITERKRAEMEIRLNEKRYRSLVEATSAVVWDTPPSGELEGEQPSWAAFTGQSHEEFRGWGWLKAIHPDDQAETARAWTEAVATKSIYKVEHRLKSRDQTYRNMMVRGVPVLGEDGTIIQWVGIHSDITERKRNETRFRRLVDSNAQGVFFWNTNGEIVSGNDAFLNITGFTREDLEAGRIDWVAMTPPEYAHLDRHALEELARTGVCQSYEKAWIRKDGSHVPILLGAAMFEDNPDDGVCFVLDITGRKRVEAELEKTHKDLLQASRQAGMAEVATGILHNVGNVLNSVNVASICVAESIKKSKATNLSRVVAMLRDHQANLADFISNDAKGKQLPGFLALLAEQLAGEQAQLLKELAGLQTNIEHIRHIVTAQQSHAKNSGLRQNVNVNDLVEETLRMDLSALARHDIQVIKEFKNTPPVLVEKHKVLQILLNLVRNARQACEATDQPEKKLTIRTTKGEGSVRIIVGDNGAGIRPEDMQRIFARGFTTKKDGHGFGLHSAALAAKEMGGELRVESDGIGLGATFTLELPWKPNDQEFTGHTGSVVSVGIAP